MPEPFAGFAKRLTTSYVVLAVALIVLVVATTTILAFILYVGSLNEAIAANAQRAGQKAVTYERLREPLNEYAPELAAEIGGPRIGVRIYDASHRLLAASSRGTTTPGRFTRAAAAIFGLRPSVVRVAGGTIVIAPDLAGFTRLLARYLAFVIPIGALAVFAAWLLGRAITRRAIAPLREVALALHRIAAGNFAPEPLPAGETSLRELTAAYNEVAHRLTTATAERERNELQMRQFVADAGHELRTPLTIVMGYLEILRQGVVGDPDGVARAYETMLAESRRMRDTIDKLIMLARLERPAAPRTTRVDAGTVAKRAADALEPLAGSGRVRVVASPAIVEADENELYEAIKNIVENAVRYAPASPVKVDVTSGDAGVSIVVTDGGPGISAQDLEHAFDRFYRGGNRTGEGTGLGLAIAKRAVERIGGTIVIQSRLGAGTTVTIALPRGSENL
ncbi:MAG: HAMP domain-containing sensor histidine kinase [Candidatus Cybelea sp.]